MKVSVTHVFLLAFLPFSLFGFEITSVSPANNEVVPLLNAWQKKF